jgi:alkanesulfonate monooxygenase SsuD/methylene tetrahydromethanopterin reductase-like flavin-dependent oxidoreductase (luciferase family)
MGQIWLRYDVRTGNFGPSAARLCSIALEQAAWGDKQGFDAIQLPEHHGSPDGYNPSPFILGAAMAAVTSRIRIHPSAVLLPLHDPIRVAEDVAVLDNISNGRVDLTIGLGYVPSEFAMFGISLKARGKLADSKLLALRRALAGDRFDYEGRPVHVTPRPVQKPHPAMYVGGAVPASAIRAAELGDGFLPTVMTDELRQAYIDRCAALGKPPGAILDITRGPSFIFVTEDPDAAWKQIGPHVMYETNAYARWAEATGTIMRFKPVETLEDARALPNYKVVTPRQCIELGTELHRTDSLMIFTPSLAGLSEDLSWSSLELFADKVLPALRAL